MKPQTQKAIDFIEQKLAAGEWKTGDRLPSVHQLAKMVRIGIHPMRDALEILKTEGKIAGQKRLGIFAGNRIPPNLIDSPTPMKKWEKLRVQIESDIIDQSLDENQQFSIKELSQQYNVTPFLCRKAIQSLVNEGRLIAKGKQFKITSYRHATSFASMLFISQVDGDKSTPHGDHISLFNLRIYEFLTAAAQSCDKHGVKFSKLGINFGIAHSREKIVEALASNKYIGYVLYLPGHIDYAVKQNFIMLFASKNKPVAFVLDSGEMILPDAFTKRHHAKVFFLDEKNAGYRVGRFLQDQGHESRNVAYISEDSSNKPWSQMRFTGLRTAYATAHDTHSPALFSTTTRVPQNQTSYSHIKADRQRLAVSIDAMSDDSEIATVLLTYQQNTIDTQFDSSTQFAALLPLFTKIATEASYSVWVCENDNLAFAADFFFYKHPQYCRVPIIGFDNSPLARFKIFTTYDFDFGAIGRKAVAYILNPESQVFGKRREIACEGYVVEW